MKDILISLNKAVQDDLSDENAAYILCFSHDKQVTADGENTLVLHFQDLDDDKSPDAFQVSHAKQIVRFYEQIRDNDRITCIFVCCDGGISRSPAIAAALMRAQGQNDNVIWSDREYDPNTLVYRRLCHAFGHPVTSRELRRKVRQNREAWSGSLFQILKQGIEEIIAYQRGEIALRVTTIDDEGNRHTECRKKSMAKKG